MGSMSVIFAYSTNLIFWSELLQSAVSKALQHLIIPASYACYSPGPKMLRNPPHTGGRRQQHYHASMSPKTCLSPSVHGPSSRQYLCSSSSARFAPALTFDVEFTLKHHTWLMVPSLSVLQRRRLIHSILIPRKALKIARQWLLFRSRPRISSRLRVA